MSVLYITEFCDAGSGGSGDTNQVAAQLPTAEQTVAISGSSTQSSIFNSNTRIVRLHTDSICSIEFGINPTASTTTARMAANNTEYFQIPTNSTYKVAVIANT